MALTGDTLRAALAAVGAVGKQIKSFDELAAGATDALRQAPAGLTAAGAASFLATLAQESAYLRTTVEYGTGQRYAPYIGRTFEQITWESGYRGFGQWCKAHSLLSDSEQFVKDPASLGDYRWAWLGGVYYFETAGLWKYANAGNHLAVSQGVNGGTGRIGTSFVPNGWDARNAMYQAFLKAGDALLPAPPPPAPTPSPAAPASSEDDVAIQNIVIAPGSGEMTLRLPVGKGAIASSRGWISANLRAGATQPGQVRWWFQSADAGISRRDWTTLTAKDGLSTECTDEAPAGTRKINVQWNFPEGGTICLEAIR